MSVFATLKESVSSHPALWGVGTVIVLVGGYFLFFRGGSSAAAPTNFTYSTGPSAAQVAAGTAQQIASQQDQTAVSLANIAATTQTALGKDQVTENGQVYGTQQVLANLQASVAETLGQQAIGENDQTWNWIAGLAGSGKKVKVGSGGISVS